MLYGYNRITGEPVIRNGEEERKILSKIHKDDHLYETEISVDGHYLYTMDNDTYNAFTKKHGHPISEDLQRSANGLHFEEWLAKVEELNPGWEAYEAIGQYIFLSCMRAINPKFYDKNGMTIMPNI